MEIHALPALKDNYVYVLTEGDACAVVDPGEAAPVEAFVAERGLKVTHVLLTHHHADHVGGADRFDAEIWCSTHDRERLPFATRSLGDGERVDVLGTKFEVIATPGHTLGAVSFYSAKELALFTGDTLFSAGCGRLFEGTFEQMHASLGRLKRLPSETKIYFGHEYTANNLAFVNAHLHLARDSDRLGRSVAEARRFLASRTSPSNLARELEINPFLAADSTADFTRWREARNHW